MTIHNLQFALLSPSLRTTVAYFTAFIALGMVVGVLGPTLPGLATQTESALSAISFLFITNALGKLLGAFVGGRLYDRRTGHPIMVLVLVLLAILMGLIPWSATLWTVSLAFFLLGVAGGTLDIGGNTLIVWLHEHRVGPYMNGLHFCFGVGAFLAPLMVALSMTATSDIDWAYWGMGLLMLPIALWLARLPSPVLQESPTPKSMDGKVQRPFLVLIVLFIFFYAGTESGFGSWIYTYAVRHGLADETVAAYLTSGFWGALTAGRLLAIPLTNRFSPRFVLMGDMVGCLISVGILWTGTDSLVQTWIGTIGLGLSMASVFPTALAFGERHMTMRGSVTRWFFVGAGTGAMIFPWLIGQWLEQVGPNVLNYGIGLCITTSLLLLTLLTGFITRNSKVVARL